MCALRWTGAGLRDSKRAGRRVEVVRFLRGEGAYILSGVAGGWMFKPGVWCGYPCECVVGCTRTVAGGGRRVKPGDVAASYVMAVGEMDGARSGEKGSTRN